MAVDILELLAELEDEVNAARRPIMGSGVVIDRRRVLDLIEALREAIPANIKQARGVLSRGEQAIREAEGRAARIVADAEREAEQLVSAAAITRAAQERAYGIERQAEERARRILAAAQADAERQLAEAAERARTQEAEADSYALAMLTAVEERLAPFLASIRAAKAQFGEPTSE